MMACTYCTKCLFNFKRNSIYQYLNVVRYKSDGTKVVLLNSYSKVGILTAYLLKKTSLFSEICLHEPRNIQAIEGIVGDLNNINTPALVTSQRGRTSVIEALDNASIVVMMEKKIRINSDPCGRKKQEQVCRTPLEVAANLLNKVFVQNADYCAVLAESYAKACPAAFLVVAMKPVNSTLPLACKVAGTVNHNVNLQKILGFMTLDVVTANLIWAKTSNMKMENIKVPVIGGSSAYTIIPLFSQMKHPDDEEDMAGEEKLNTIFRKLTEDVRKFNEVMLLNQKSSPLSTAAAIAKFVISLGTAVKGNELKEYAFVQSNLVPELAFLGGPIQLGPSGVQKILPLPKISDYEKLLLESIPYYLINDIKRGEEYADKYLKKIDCK